MAVTTIARTKEPFKKQYDILTCVVKNLCCRDGLPIREIGMVSRLHEVEVEPKFQPVSELLYTLN